MCSGVVPQHPPTRLTNPDRAHSHYNLGLVYAYRDSAARAEAATFHAVFHAAAVAVAVVTLCPAVEAARTVGSRTLPAKE